MKLPSGQEVKDETISEMADFIAMDVLSTDSSFDDSAGVVAEELQDGYEGEYETLPVLHLKDKQFLLEAVRVPTLEYLEKLRLARSVLFNEMLQDRKW